ncbi:MAG TPA: hypothetical protein VNI54_09050 [Thermoanaerobaculia bacterium]|nr:hypothetical protein [Thermoanaerobaculia bacterium]
MKLSRILFSLMIVAACSGFRSAPERPWRIEVSTTGGLTGRGIGGFAVDSDRKVEVRRMNGEVCRYTMTGEELAHIERLLAEARPERWRESYLPENTCCDRIISTFTVDEAGDVVTTRWIDAPPASPKDLAALANAIVGPEKSIRAESAERCK